MPNISEVQNLDPDDNIQTNDGVPGAAESGQVAQGEPRDYSGRGDHDDEAGDYGAAARPVSERTQTPSSPDTPTMP